MHPWRDLPRQRLAFLPTPLEPASRLAERLGCNLFVKREDQSGLGMGGNKARQIEVVLAQARVEGADTVITTAGAQSNFCRTFAAAAAKLGFRCVLLLRGDGRAPPTGNLLLDRLFGAEIHWIDTSDPYDPRVKDRLAELLRDYGPRSHLVHLPGVTGPLVAAAAASLADEIAQQVPALPSAIYLAVGSGLTAAGLLVGLTAMGLPTRVVAISVQQPSDFIRPLILKRAEEAAELLGLDLLIDESRLDVDDRFIGEGYGKPTAAGLDALELAGRLEGLVLDPAYSGKALAGLIGHAAEGRFEGVDTVVFVHSGGAPTLFAHSESVAAHLGPAR